MTNHQLITIDTIVIKQDDQGRYCLNDLQRAAALGSNPRTTEVYEYMRRPETQDLITEIENTGNSRNKAVETKRGRTGGTFVVKELVYAYAMWISPQFHLKVIRAYDRLATQGVAIHEAHTERFMDNPLAYFEKLLDQAKVLQAQVKVVTVERDVAIEERNVARGRVEELKRLKLLISTNGASLTVH